MDNNLLTFEEFKRKFKLKLDKDQEEAVKNVNGPLLVLAIPGSGKTTTLVARLGYMVYCKGIKPEEILTVTYTVAATEDMRRRFLNCFGDEFASRMEFRTINGISQKVLTYYGIATGKTPFKVADREIPSLIRESYMKVNEGFPTDNDIQNIGTLIGFAKNMRLNDRQIKDLEKQQKGFYEIYTVYNELLRKRCLIDYDDQMVYALKLLSGFKEVLSYFQKTYKYFLVDEAQDTSKIQHDIMDILSNKSNNLFMVGDEDQSIYGFRAAYPKALIDFEKNHKNARVLTLKTNYRSGSEIVAAAAVTISKNTQRYKKKLVAARKDTGKVIRLDTSSRNNQYKYIAKALEESDKQIAILYRNNESALPLIDMFERFGVSYRIKQSDVSYFSSPVICDIRDFVSLANNPSDGEAFLRIYYKMGAMVSKVMANAAVRNAGSEGIIEHIAASNTISEGLRKRLNSLSVYFNRLLKVDACQAVDIIVNNMGYGEFIENRGLDDKKIDILRILGRQVRNINELMARLEILNDIMLEGNKDYDSKVFLSTIHSAKGLEFDTVYMLDMIDGILPSVKKPGRYASEEEIAQYEEERRLYYVAMTRAKNELYIFTFNYFSTSPFSRELFKMQPEPDKIQGTNKSLLPKYLKSTDYGKAKPNKAPQE